MALLYINSKGDVQRRHSYSAGLEYDRCPFAYYQKRVLGWREKDDRASFKFGRALEQAIQFYHDNIGKGGIEKFIELWAAHKDETDLKFTKTERDWSSLNKAGIEMMRLYIIRQPSLPLPLGGSVVFQREYSKFIFDGDPEYGDIEFMGKLDIVSYVSPDHSMLPKVNWKPEYGILRPLAIDIKTSAIDLPENPGIAAYDKQLRAYSWLTGIRDCALLWFKKCGHNFQKGSSITLLADAGNFKAGAEAVVAKVDGDKAYVVANDFMLEEMAKAQGKKEDGSTDQSKAAKEKGMAWLKENAPLVPISDMTRQRLQFNIGFVTIESANDAGQIAARQIVQIVNSWKTKTYPQTFGIRFPSDDRNDPYFRAFVLNDVAFKNDNFKQADSEAFDDLFEDEGPEEQ